MNSNLGLGYQSADSEHLVKRIRLGQADEVSYPAPIHPPSMYLQEIPKIVSRTINQGSNVMNMDFSPTAANNTASWDECW